MWRRAAFATPIDALPAGAGTPGGSDATELAAAHAARTPKLSSRSDSTRYASLLAVMSVLLAASPVAAQTEFKATTLLKSDRTMEGERLSYPRTDNAEVTATLMEIAPGGETGFHMHTAPTFVYVLQGTVEVEEQSSGMKHTHGAGEAFLHQLNVLHNGRNKGSAPVQILVVSFGERGRPVMSRPQ
jgi:quercetin dioxygenase-like cupin family protein